jgi:hypothetical protein
MQEIASKPQVKEVHKYRITPSAMFNGEMPIICQFTDGESGEVISLLEGGKHGQVKEGAIDQKLHTLRMVTFSKTTPFLEIEVDPNNLKDEGLIAIQKFWKRHPKVGSKNGEVNRNADGQPLMLIENVTATKGDKKGHVMKVKQAIEKYNGLSERSRKNVAYLFGHTGADTMDETDLYLLLADPMMGGGTIIQAGNIDKFLAYQPEDEDSQLQINVRRAVERDLIKREGSTFMVNNSPIATDENGVIAYFKNNQDFYGRYVIDALGDDAEKVRIEKKKVQDENIETIDVNALRDECKAIFEQCKALGATGLQAQRWAVMSVPKKLQDAIKEGKEWLEAKK